MVQKVSGSIPDKHPNGKDSPFLFYFKISVMLRGNGFKSRMSIHSMVFGKLPIIGVSPFSLFFVGMFIFCMIGLSDALFKTAEEVQGTVKSITPSSQDDDYITVALEVSDNKVITFPAGNVTAHSYSEFFKSKEKISVVIYKGRIFGGSYSSSFPVSLK